MNISIQGYSSDTRWRSMVGTLGTLGTRGGTGEECDGV
jgi:hypothetical protein